MANLFGPRPMVEAKEELLGRARENRNPFLCTVYDEVAPVIDGLQTVERENWAKAFSGLALPHEERAKKAEAAADSATARKEFLIAYDCYHVARYPAPNSRRGSPPTESRKRIFLKPRVTSIRRWSVSSCRSKDARVKARPPWAFAQAERRGQSTGRDVVGRYRCV